MKPLLIIAGAGQTGRELSVRMEPNWRVAILDKNPAKLEVLEGEGCPADITCVEGDATSALVLRSAGMESAQSAVALTGRDDVNLEFCRLARQEFQVSQVLSVVVLRTQLPQFEELGVEVFSRPYSVASALQSRLEHGKRTTADIGLGQGEICEVTVLPHSPVIGQAMADLHPHSWLVGAIYRAGRLVVPHGNTVVEEGDRVLLVGEPAVVPAIADYFRSGTSEFPLQYGTRVVVVNPCGEREGRSVDEAFYLARNSRAFGVKFQLSPGQDPDVLQQLCRSAEIECSVVTNGAPLNEFTEACDCGCLVLPAPKPRLLDRLGMGRRDILSMLDQIDQPCLLSRGTYPYDKILVAVCPGAGPARAVELALDVARLFQASLTACTVLPPSFVTGEQKSEELQMALEQAVRIGALYSMKISSQRLEGNPVHQVEALASDFNLLVIAHHKRQRFSITRPDVSRHLLFRAPCSVMVLPYGGSEADGR